MTIQQSVSPKVAPARVFGVFYWSNIRSCLRRWNLRGEAEEGATTPFVATRTDVDRRGAGYGVPPLVPKGGHQERRPKEPEYSQQHQGGTCRVLRTFLGRWQAHRDVSGQRYCWSPGHGQVQRHTGVGYELVQALDAPVLQMVEHLPDVHHFFASCLPVVAEQVVDVPKIILEHIPSRRQCREPQLAEVPMVLTPSFLRMLQNVDIPVPHGCRGASGGLQGFLPGHVEQTLTFQLRAVLSDVFKVFSQNRVQLRLLLRPWNAFLSGMWSRSLFLVVLKFWMSLGMGFFALFPKLKKVRHYLRTRGRNCLCTRAHGRRHLMTSLWCSRRRRRRTSPRRSLTMTLSSWSMMGAGGGASGSRLASDIAGGWPRQMGHRLAIQSGGRRGSSGVDQGDVLGTTVDTWSASVLELVPYFSSFLREGELGS